MPVSVIERIDMTRNAEGGLDSSSARRIELWNKAIEMFGESPIFGKGFNSFQIYTKWDTHNLYIKVLAELGIVGLFSLLYLLFMSFKIGWRLFRESHDSLFKGLGLGFAACVISVAVTNAFGDRWSYLPLGAYFWVYLGIVTSAYLITKNEAVHKKAQ